MMKSTKHLTRLLDTLPPPLLPNSEPTHTRTPQGAVTQLSVELRKSLSFLIT